ncbi:hypothetical protein BGM26_15440 [Bacillus sp. FJAT-29790]|uniref:MetQ/NlpA family ABC transporter substrate-binding protein n=1 Tax=Bacillus sp. FJAT-29790 TaxID=1895002 RepID=UPI001C213114|nr:MetQ/NlpA family ABC transporter substrate-binding protein [Bacillus sp. FJAT-29790]MBU8880345.1 hypothetical protein [Bacillus sp. FJAT-29790]
MKKLLISLLLLVGAFILGACGGSESASGDKKEITIGATAGPYSDQLKNAITPILEKEGYKVKVIEFNDYIQPNNALNEGELDANLFQHQVYLEQFNKDHDMDLTPLFAVPTAPIGLYSEKHQSLDDVKEGMKVTLPNDPTNLARALRMLVGYGWITIKDDVNPTKASEKDIVENKYNLKIQPLEAAQLPRSLGDTDFAFINGNYALASGLKFADATDLEKTPEEYMNHFVIRKEEKDQPFVQAIEEAFRSKEFLEYTNENLAGYTKPSYLAE